MFAFAALLTLAALSPVSSQRMVIYNTTGNATDATGIEEIQDIDDLPKRLAIPTDIVEEPPANITQEKTNATSEYPPSSKVVILEGAALKAERAFDPDPVRINRGGLITWVNADIVTHTVTSGSGFSDPKMGEQFDSGLMGSSYKKAFDKAGEYPYFCQVHPQMVGLVIVKATEKADVMSGGNETAVAIANAMDQNTGDNRPDSAITNEDGSETWIDGVIDFFNGIFGQN